MNQSGDKEFWDHELEYFKRTYEKQPDPQPASVAVKEDGGGEPMSAEFATEMLEQCALSEHNVRGWLEELFEAQHLISTLRATMQADKERIADWEEAQEDKRRLCREIDRIMNGKDAAKQASLCDLVGQIRDIVAERDSLKAQAIHIAGLPADAEEKLAELLAIRSVEVGERPKSHPVLINGMNVDPKGKYEVLHADEANAYIDKLLAVIRKVD